MELPRQAPFPPDPDPVFDRFARAVGMEFSVPVALVSFVDAAGQNMPGAQGLPEPWQTERWAPLSHSFCQYVVTSGRPFVIPNAHDDPLVAENLAVMELGVIAYAGMPTRDAGGRVVGSLCAIDHRPRDWPPAELIALSRLAGELSAELARRAG